MNGEAADPVMQRAYARVGTMLRNKWRLERLLGVGGMASVYLGAHRNGARGAVKILHPELSIDAGIRARFLKEGYAANLVGHPGAVAVLDDDEADGLVFLVMELLEGESLERRAQRAGGTLPVDEVLSIMDQVLDVLVAAHLKNIVHRDLKPENLFLTKAGQAKVLDFGLARLLDDPARPGATQAGMAMGTPCFMPPEQAKGEWTEVDGRSDLWAVGATMFTLLTGRLVHEAATPNQTLLRAMTTPAVPLRTLAKDCPLAVGALVDTALAFDKSARWRDAQTMQDALRDAYYNHLGAPISSAPKMTVPPRAEDDEDVTRIAAGDVGISAKVALAAASPERAPATSNRTLALVVIVALVVAVTGLATIFVLNHSARGDGLAAANPSPPVASSAAPVATPSEAPIVAPAAASDPQVAIATPADSAKKKPNVATPTPTSPTATATNRRGRPNPQNDGPMVNDL